MRRNTVRAGRLLLLSACTLAAVVIIVAWVVSYPRAFYVQLVGATGWELIAVNGQFSFNRYGGWPTPDGSMRFADLPAAPPAEVGWGNTRFYYLHDLEQQWGWRYNGESGGRPRGIGVTVSRGSVLLKPITGGATVQVGRDMYGMAGWLPVLIFGLWPGVVGIMAARRWWTPRQLRSDPTPRCTSCGYDIRATPGRCPECGATPLAIAGTGVAKVQP